MDKDNAAHKFNSGDVVRLKSGGPRMTVRQYRDEDEVWCCHMAITGLQSVYLPESMLEHVGVQEDKTVTSQVSLATIGQ